MAGVFTTCVIAALHNRNSIGVELEHKFIEMFTGVNCDGYTCHVLGCYKRKDIEKEMTELKDRLKEGNNEETKTKLKKLQNELQQLPQKTHHYIGTLENLQNLSSLTPKGWIKAIQGDSRKLSELLKKEQIDNIATSPPYVNATAFQDINFMKNTAKTRGEKIKAGESKGHYFTEEAHKRAVGKIEHGKYEEENNIVNLPVDDVDAIITSPPYSGTLSVKSGGMAGELDKSGDRQRKNLPSPYSDDPTNIGNLPIGDVDAIITSPPYSEGQFDYKHGMKRYVSPNWKGRKAFEEKRKMDYSEDNITLLKHGDIDAIITSPPYSEGIGHDSGNNASEQFKERLDMQRKYTRQMASKGNIATLKHGDIDAIITSPPYESSMEGGSRHTGGIVERTKDPHSDTTVKGGLGIKYSDNKDNIGNLKKETYLEAMLTVYSECYKVLRSGGRIIIIIKPFYRNKKVIDLPWHTYILLTKCGFVLEDVLKLRLQKLSFWRVLQFKKFPNLEQVRHEYIIVMKKPN
jgi:DNA modification methylase